MDGVVIRHLSFDCAGVACIGSLHEGSDAGGVLIVSGGQDLRSGAHRWQAELARSLAAAGHPVFRFDRRGVGDSPGPRTSYRESLSDLRAAAATFRAEVPTLNRVIGLGNCDGATALALYGQEVGLDGLLLLNPWLVPTQDDLPAPAAIRARYRSRLLDPAAWLRLLRGDIDLRKAVRGLARMSAGDGNPLAGEVAQALTAAGAPRAYLILAAGDATAIACRAAWQTEGFARLRGSVPVTTIDTGSHSFGGEGDAERLTAAVLAALPAFG